MNGGDIHALSGAYALDAVDDLERVAFERHLADCDTCAQEVRELRETAARLADMTAVAAPAGLRTSVLAAVARTPQTMRTRPDRAAVASASRWRRLTAVAVAAGVIAGGVGVGTWTVSERRVRDAQSVAAAERARSAEIEAILSAPDARVVPATVTDVGVVTVAVAPSRNAAVAMLSGLPRLTTDRTYQLWLMPHDAAPQSVRVLPPGQTGGAQVLRGFRSGDSFGLSREPAGGSTKPTDAVLTVPLA